jgi:hypothetical protein
MVCRTVRALRTLGRKANGLAIGKQMGANGNNTVTHTKARIDPRKSIIGITNSNRNPLHQEALTCRFNAHD